MSRARGLREAGRPVERGAPARERLARRAVGERGEGGRVRVREPRLGGAREEEQVRVASPLRTQSDRLHRAPGPRRLGRVPQHQDPGAAVTVRARLSAMMFLQFFLWGAWYTTLALYITHPGRKTLP